MRRASIDLAASDDDQLIFETLNDRGTPLLQADLIKNFVFERCEGLHADVDQWNDTYWGDFDDDWWRGQVAQGRLYRSRIDLFLQYWLTMQLQEEIPTDAVFRRFRTYAGQALTDLVSAESFLQTLRSQADRFRELTDLDPDSAAGRFFRRVVEALELGAFTPLLLRLIGEDVQSMPREVALSSIESWAVRRTLLRRTMKDVNKLVVALLRELADRTGEDPGDVVASFLRAQTADSREWPSDEAMLDELPSIRAYGNIKQQRLRAVLGAIELHRRTARHEALPLPARLDVEHVMPRGWRLHWGGDAVSDPLKASARDRLVDTIGNLTLVTEKLNGALSNRPWTDTEAVALSSKGKEAGKGKCSLLKKYSLLVLNKDLTDEHQQVWTEDDIRHRSSELAHDITEIWRGPESG